jgi:hypothetical protein
MESKELKTPIKIRLKMKIHNVDPFIHCKTYLLWYLRFRPFDRSKGELTSNIFDLGLS